MLAKVVVVEVVLVFAVNEEFKLVLVFEYGETTVHIGAFPLEVTVVQEDVVVDAEDVDFTCLEEL